MNAPLPTSRLFQSREDVLRHVGQELVLTDWFTVDRTRIEQFADATGDHQWIHLDEARAAKESPFGGTVAHGFLTLSLVATFVMDAVKCEGMSSGVNYGLNKVRFPNPVRTGSRVRCRISLLAADELPEGALQITWGTAIEVEGKAKPACVAEMLLRWYF